MSPLDLILFILLGAAAYIFYRWVRSRSRKSSARQSEINAWIDEACGTVSDPKTSPAVLRKYLAMENPPDDLFFARLAVLRELAQNPSLPTELQAAAINRITQEESIARLDKSLRRASRRGGAYVGMSFPI